MRTEMCPQCGSAKLEVTTEGELMTHLAGGNVRCTNCGWGGPKADLLTSEVPEQPEMTQDQAYAIALQVAQQYFISLAEHASQGIGLAMIEAGVIGVKDKTQLARLIRAATSGAHQATLREVEKIQKESEGESTN